MSKSTPKVSRAFTWWSGTRVRSLSSWVSKAVMARIDYRLAGGDANGWFIRGRDSPATRGAARRKAHVAHAGRRLPDHHRHATALGLRRRDRGRRPDPARAGPGAGRGQGR